MVGAAGPYLVGIRILSIPHAGNHVLAFISPACRVLQTSSGFTLCPLRALFSMLTPYSSTNLCIHRWPGPLQEWADSPHFTQGPRNPGTPLMNRLVDSSGVIGWLPCWTPRSHLSSSLCSSCGGRRCAPQRLKHRPSNAAWYHKAVKPESFNKLPKYR